MKKTPIEIPYILNKDFILNNLMTKNGDRFNTNLFKTIKIHKSYKWCSSISEYLYCILLEYTEQPKCKNEDCTKVVKYNQTQERKYNTFCSPSCSTSSKQTQEKQKKTNKEKYGVEFASQSKKVKEKVKETNIKKYGKSCSLQNEEIKKKTKKTNKEKYGKEEFFASDIIKEKIKETNIKKYGCKSTLQSKEVKEKIKEKNKKKYGSEYSTQKNIKNYEDLNKKYIEFFFKDKKEKIDFEKLCDYYNISITTAYRYINKFDINYISVSNIEKNINKEFNNVFKLKNKQIINIKEDGKKRKLELDLFNEKEKIAIEYNGLMYHSFGKSKHTIFNNYEKEKEKFSKKKKNYEKHLLKTELCEDKKIQLFHIFENEWLNEDKRNIWKSMINNKLKKEVIKRVFARKCYVEVLTNEQLSKKRKQTNNRMSKKFENENHLQGSGISSIKIGLFYNEEVDGKVIKKLVSLMTFGKSRYNHNYEYELIRFCTLKNYQVVGGASKLLKKFEREFNPKSLISYANRRWSNGNLYKQLGFTFLNKTPANFFYFKENEKKLKSRNSFQKHKLKEMYKKGILKEYDDNLTAILNAYNNGYRRIWDSGNLSFIKKY